MSIVPIDVSELPNARFWAASGIFPYIVANEIQSQQRAVDALNIQGRAAWDYAVAQWTLNATIARGKDAKVVLPPKPVSPPSWVLLAQDGKNENNVRGTWIAQSQTGPVYGVCPDLPVLIPTPPGVISNPDKNVLTQDQKLDSIAATVVDTQKIVVDIQKILKAALQGLAVLLLLFVPIRTSSAASIGTVYTVGFEDWSGSGSDRDFNDTVFQITGLTFHDTGAWTRPSPPAFPGEIQFPFATGWYFNGATATGDLISTFLFQQTAAASIETAWVRVGSGSAWLPIVGSMTLGATAGDVVSFRLSVGPDYLYPDGSNGGNLDGLPHAVEAHVVPDPKGDVPEPEGMVLIGSGLLMLGLGMKLWKR